MNWQRRWNEQTEQRLNTGDGYEQMNRGNRGLVEKIGMNRQMMEYGDRIGEQEKQGMTREIGNEQMYRGNRDFETADK